MIIVADTSPLNYLVLCGKEAVLPSLFSRVKAPPAVMSELRSEKTPATVKAWADHPPLWIEIQTPLNVDTGNRLGPGGTAFGTSQS